MKFAILSALLSIAAIAEHNEIPAEKKFEEAVTDAADAFLSHYEGDLEEFLDEVQAQIIEAKQKQIDDAE